MRIGEVAERAGVSAKAVRYYESLGLLAVDRHTNGYRDYDESQVELVREIRSLGRLGIPADDTRPFLDCLVSGNLRGDDCSESVATYSATIDELSTRIDELSARREALRQLRDHAVMRGEPLCEFSKETTSVSHDS
ncbi:MAG: MerR family transcriptional regulator [Rhodoglobus sp.]